MKGCRLFDSAWLFRVLPFALGFAAALFANAAPAQTYVFLSLFGSTGTGNGQFRLPEGVAIDPTSHNIVVSDAANGRVQIFTSAGTFISKFGSSGSGDGQFSNPERHRNRSEQPQHRRGRHRRQHSCADLRFCR